MVATQRLFEETRKCWVKGSPRQAAGLFAEALKAKDINPGNFSIREAALGLVFDRHGESCGREWVESLDPRRMRSFVEAADDVVTTAAFSNITGQVIYSAMLEAYQMPGLLWDQLVTTVQTNLSGEKIPGVTGIGDDLGTINEGEPYPHVGYGQEFVETPETVKKGAIVAVTKEAIFFDRTNLVLQRAQELGQWAAVNKEKSVMNVVTGQTNPFKRNGTAYNTYATSGGHGIVNQIADVLYDWTDIAAAMEKFDGMTDWTTSEPIIVRPDVLLVPFALLPEAYRAINPSEVRGGVANGTTYQSISPNPLNAYGMGSIRVLNNAYVKVATSSDVKWFFGQPKKAFRWMQNWDMTPEQAGTNSEAAFERDVVAQFKISYRGVAAVVDPHYMVYSSGGS